MNKIGMIAAALALGISSAQADFTQGLLARWSFNDNSNEAKALTDDVGGLTMKRSAIGSDSKFKVNADGSVTLGGGVILFSDAVNSASEKFGVLADGGTIWCRIKYLNAPAGGPFFSFGLVNAVAPGDWAQLVLTPFFASEGLAPAPRGRESSKPAWPPATCRSRSGNMRTWRSSSTARPKRSLSSWTARRRIATPR